MHRNNKVIEPTEIIVENAPPPKEKKGKAEPWIRFLARFFDYALFFGLLLWSRKFFQGQLPFGKYEYLVPFEFFVWIPIEALLLTTWGTTPGKFLLRITLKRGKKKRLDFATALKRSFAVWFRGLGMGIPVLNFFCLLVAFNKLKILQITSWDRDDHIIVTHHPFHRVRLYIAIFIAILGNGYYYTEKNIELTKTQVK